MSLRTIVKAVAAFTHAPAQSVLVNEPSVRVRTILASAVTVDDNAARALALAPPQSHFERVTHQSCWHALVHCPANHLARIQVDDRGQIQPPLIGREIADIGHPFLIRRTGVEVLLQ